MTTANLTRRAALMGAAGLTTIPAVAHAASKPPPPVALPPSAKRTPFDYGAAFDTKPGTDQQQAVQAMLDDCAASWDPEAGQFSKHPDLAGRTWFVGTGVSLTNVRTPGMVLRNGTLWGKGEGSTVLDLSGTNSVHLQNVQIFGDRGDPPKVGILTSRTEEAGNYSIAPNLEWFNVRTWGSFSGAGVISIATEVTSFLQCAIENNSKNTAAFAYMNVQNLKAVTDRIGPIKSKTTLPKAGRRHSNIIHSFDQVRIKRPARFNAAIAQISQTNPAVVTLRNPKRIKIGDLQDGDRVWFYDVPAKSRLKYTVQTVVNVNPGAGTFELKDFDNRDGVPVAGGRVQNQTGPAMLFCGANDVHISNGYTLTYGNHSVVFDLVNGTAPRSFRMHMQCEHSPSAPILIEHGDKPRVWQGADIHLSNAAQTNSMCVIDDTGSGVLQLHDMKLKINNMQRPPARKVFKNPGRIALRDCEITVPRAAALNNPDDFKAAGAVFEAYDRTDARHDWRPTEHFRLKNRGAPVATLETAASDDLNNKRSTINTANKHAGKMVFNTTDGRPVFASGRKPGSPWRDAMGKPVHRPK